jgi:hypothetical protein
LLGGQNFNTEDSTFLNISSHIITPRAAIHLPQIQSFRHAGLDPVSRDP